MKNGLIIGIDGPAASGKSTTAKRVAQALGYLYIDTGAMYRALTVKALEEDIDLSDDDALTQLANKTEIQMKNIDGETTTFLDGRDVSDEIRSPEVSRNVSTVCAPKGVRERMVTLQREMGKAGEVVLEGRDIGTTVFPDADLLVYMIATIDERARRRAKDLEEKGYSVNINQLKEEIRLRDEKDSNRDHSPLKKAEKAYLLDTTSLTIDEQVSWIVEKAHEIMNNGNAY